MGEEDFKWSDSEAVVFKSVDAVAVYRNGDGDVVIRQESRMDTDDSFIVIPDAQVGILIDALQNIVGD